MSATYCEAHDLLVTDGLVCPACARAQLRETVNVLESRIADQGAELLDLRRQLNELRQIVQSTQQAHSRLASLVAAIQERMRGLKWGPSYADE